MSRLIALLLLIAVFLLSLASVHPWDIALGALIAAGAWLVARRFLAGSALNAGSAAGASITGRIIGFLPFCAAVLWDVLLGSWRVGLITVGLRPMPPSGIVAIPIGDRTPTGIAVSSLVTTLSPGTCLLEVDQVSGVFYLHVLDARDPDGIRAAHQQFYDRYQRRVFP